MPYTRIMSWHALGQTIQLTCCVDVIGFRYILLYYMAFVWGFYCCVTLVWLQQYVKLYISGYPEAKGFMSRKHARKLGPDGGSRHDDPPSSRGPRPFIAIFTPNPYPIPSPPHSGVVLTCSISLYSRAFHQYRRCIMSFLEYVGPKTCAWARGFGKRPYAYRGFIYELFQRPEDTTLDHHSLGVRE